VAAELVRQVCEDMLWVWGESGPTAFIDSAAKTPATTTVNASCTWNEMVLRRVRHPVTTHRLCHTTPATLQELDALPGGTHINKSKPYIRDLHYDYATLVENFLDPAHVRRRSVCLHGVLRHEPTKMVTMCLSASFDSRCASQLRLTAHPIHMCRCRSLTMACWATGRCRGCFCPVTATFKTLGADMLLEPPGTCQERAPCRSSAQAQSTPCPMAASASI
jgi:hypothetical protein